MKEYDVFLSYSHAELAIAEMLSKRIRRFNIPKRLGHHLKKLEVFRDKERLTAGSDLSDLLTENLSSSRHLVLIISPSSKKSLYVNDEVAAYIKARDAKSIIFVLVEGELADNLPAVLQDQAIEPLFIDLRSLNKKKFRHESLRLIAALLNIDFTLLSLEDLKYRRRKRQITIAGIATALIVAASIYLIISTDKYHWKQIDQPRTVEEIMPVHEIVVNKKDPSIVLFKGVNAKYGSNPRPQGESIKPIGESSLYNEIILNNKNLETYLKKQKEMRPVISIDFQLTNQEGKGEINIYAVLSDKDTIYFLRNLHFKGKDMNGREKEVNGNTVLYLKNKDMSDLYPVMKVLAEEQIADFNTQIEAIVHNNIDGTTGQEIYQLKQNDEGYAEWVEVWGPADIVFSNDPAASIMIDDQPLEDIKNERDLWDTILQDPEWVSFEKRDKKNIGLFSMDSDMDSLPVILPRVFKKKIPFLTDSPPLNILKPCFKGELAEINAIVSGFGKQHGIIVEIKSIMDNEINEEKISCYLCKITNSKPWNTLNLPMPVINSGIIDLIMLDSVGKNFMILTKSKGYFRTFDEGKTWEESNYGEISFQNGTRVKTLVTLSSIYAFVDRNISVNEGANNLFVLEKRNWWQRLRIGLVQLINE